MRRVLTPRTRLIVVTNLHNPSSVLAPESALREVVDLARSVGARVLVDEVYLDAVYENTPRTAFHLGPEVVVTSSLTKVYGVSGLRCGWILAEPGLARAMWQLNNLFAATPVHPGELMSVAALEHLAIPRDRARRVVDADRLLLNQFLDSEPGVSAVRTQWGTTAFLRLKSGNVEAFLEKLRQQYETSAVPGRFFEMPQHFRIGMGANTRNVRRGPAAHQPRAGRVARARRALHQPKAMAASAAATPAATPITTGRICPFRSLRLPTCSGRTPMPTAYPTATCNPGMRTAAFSCHGACNGPAC